MTDTVRRSLKDLSSRDVILWTLKMSAVSLSITIIILWYLWDTLALSIVSYLSWIPWEWLKTSGANLVLVATSYIIYILIHSVMTSLYSEKLIIALAKKHYPTVAVVGASSVSKSLLLTLKVSTIFILLFIVFGLLLFIPIFGQFLLLYLWSVLLREPTYYEISSLFIDDKEMLKKRKKGTHSLAMIASSFNYIPFVNIFAPIFAQILFLHHTLKER